MRFLITVIFFLFLAMPYLKAEQVYIDNVVIVLDASGSMKDIMKGSGPRISRLDAAKKAITEVMKTIPQSTHVGLISFGENSNGWLYPLGVRNDAKLYKALNRVAAGGVTPLGDYMKKGADKLLDSRKSQYGYGSYRLLIVTDGEASDSGLVEKYTPDIIARGIVTDVIGVDMRQAHTLATKVHSYRSANDPASLKKAIQEVFAEVGKTSNTQTGGNAFEEIDGLSDDAAMTIINTMESSGNHPIGEKLSYAVKKEPVQNTPKPAIQQQPSTNTSSTPQATSSGGWKYLIIGLIVIIAIVSGVKKYRR